MCSTCVKVARPYSANQDQATGRCVYVIDITTSTDVPITRAPQNCIDTCPSHHSSWKRDATQEMRRLSEGDNK